MHLNVETSYRTHSLRLRQIVYGYTMLQFDTNANLDASDASDASVKVLVNRGLKLMFIQHRYSGW